MGSKKSEDPRRDDAGPLGRTVAPDRRHSLQGDTRKQKNLSPPFSGGAGCLAAIPTPNSLTRYAVPWNALGPAHETTYAARPWRELGANVQLLGGIVIAEDL